MNWKAKVLLFTTFLLELALISWYLSDKKEYLTKRQQFVTDSLAVIHDSLTVLDSIKNIETLKLAELDSQKKEADIFKHKTDSLEALLKKKAQENKSIKNDIKDRTNVFGVNNKRVAKIYDKMKPQEASRILSKLSVKEISSILANVKQKQAAKIISALDPRLAARVTELMMKKL
jgi:flagellar motility protein MotE (MotC chaperone)